MVQLKNIIIFNLVSEQSPPHMLDCERHQHQCSIWHSSTVAASKKPHIPPSSLTTRHQDEPMDLHSHPWNVSSRAWKLAHKVVYQGDYPTSLKTCSIEMRLLLSFPEKPKNYYRDNRPYVVPHYQRVRAKPRQNHCWHRRGIRLQNSKPLLKEAPKEINILTNKKNLLRI